MEQLFSTSTQTLFTSSLNDLTLSALVAKWRTVLGLSLVFSFHEVIGSNPLTQFRAQLHTGGVLRRLYEILTPTGRPTRRWEVRVKKR
jgi:hypothetical protein